MPRPRLVQSKAEASGAVLHNPKRFKDRKTPKTRRPLGEPYVRMTDEQKVAWAELQHEMPWLSSAHRPLVRLACMYLARLDAEGEIGVPSATALSSILSKLGATPVDETKVNHAEDEDEDPTDKFFQ